VTDLAHDVEAPAKAVPAIAAVAAPVAAPAAPVPMAVGPLRVGHADDLAESDAGVSAESPGRRGASRPLEGDTLRRMQTGFGTSLDHVRAHDDARAGWLSTAASARAFTTGSDVFVGRGRFAPEVAHNTMRPAGRVHRTVTDTVPPSPVGLGPEGPEMAGRGQLTADGQKSLATVLGGHAEAAGKNVSTLDGLLALSDADVATLSRGTGLQGPLKTILMGPFEGNWFKAKDCLVFGKWPGQGRPAFSRRAQLDLMLGLTNMRKTWHEDIVRRTYPLLRAQLLNDAAALDDARPTPQRAKAAAIRNDLEKPDKHLTEFKTPSGAETVTSDVDIPTGGVYSEIAVRIYNETFRREMATAHDPGTVFDLNVYSKDFVHGLSSGPTGPTIDVLNVKVEDGDVELDAALKQKQADQQELWSLVHVARFTTVEDWAVFVDKSLQGVTDPAERARQQRTYDLARSRADKFEAYIAQEKASMAVEMAAMVRTVSSWAEHENEHFTDEALKMRAANKLYETKLREVKAMRTRILEVRDAIKAKSIGPQLRPDRAAESLPAGAHVKPDPDAKRLERLVAELAGAISAAQLYGNEVYGSGGATVHAVFGVQVLRGKQKAERAKPEAERRTIDINLTPQQWYQAFNDNLGDVLKDFQHFATPHGGAEPDYWYAAFRMGKYVDRMLDAVPRLSSGGIISAEDGTKILESGDYQTLDRLRQEHLSEKSGAGGVDPTSMAPDAPGAEGPQRYFASHGASDLAQIKARALNLGGEVRRRAAMMGKTGPVTADYETVEKNQDQAAMAAAAATAAAGDKAAAGAGALGDDLRALFGSVTEVVNTMIPGDV
jgi:hypothetical protein